MPFSYDDLGTFKVKNNIYNKSDLGMNRSKKNDYWRFLPKPIQESNELKNSDKNVLGTLIFFDNGYSVEKEGNEGYFFKSLDELVEESKVSRKHLIQSISYLELKGFISRKIGDFKGRKANQYKVNLDYKIISKETDRLKSKETDISKETDTLIQKLLISKDTDTHFDYQAVKPSKETDRLKSKETTETDIDIESEKDIEIEADKDKLILNLKYKINEMNQEFNNIIKAFDNKLNKLEERINNFAKHNKMLQDRINVLEANQVIKHDNQQNTNKSNLKPIAAISEEKPINTKVEDKQVEQSKENESKKPIWSKDRYEALAKTFFHTKEETHNYLNVYYSSSENQNIYFEVLEAIQCYGSDEVKQWLQDYEPRKGKDYSKISLSDIFKNGDIGESEQDTKKSILKPISATLVQKPSNSKVDNKQVEQSQNNEDKEDLETKDEDDDLIQILLKEQLTKRFGLNRYDEANTKEEIQKLNQAICKEIIMTRNVPQNEIQLANQLNILNQ